MFSICALELEESGGGGSDGSDLVPLIVPADVQAAETGSVVQAGGFCGGDYES